MKHLKSIFINFFIITASILSFVFIINTDAFSVDTCLDCHKDERFLVQNKRLFNYYKDWKDSDHDAAGVLCQDCHGGDPNKTNKEEAHAKNLSVSSEHSMVYYKNIPQTCGKCHDKVYKYFIESKHFKDLTNVGNGPTCITCHGNPLANVYYTSIVLSTCKSCHNIQTKNHPEIVEMADQILHRLNLCRGLLKWTTKYIDTAKSNRVNTLYQNISKSWHQFNLATTDKDSEELLFELRAILREEREKKQ